MTLFATIQSISLEKWIELSLQALTPIIAIIGIIVTYPIIKTKFTETNLSKRLDIIQNANREVVKKAQKLVFKYKQLISTDSFVVDEVEFKQILLDIEDLSENAQDCSSEINTILFSTRYIIHSINNEKEKLSKFQLYDLVILIINVYQRIIFLGAKAVNIPKSLKLKKHKIINKGLDRFVTDNYIIRYKNLISGLNLDPQNAEAVIYIGYLNRIRQPLISKYSIDLYNNPSPWAKQLFLHKIYAPVHLKYSERDIDLSLYLIGFSFWNSIGKSNKEIRINYLIRWDGIMSTKITNQILKLSKDAFIDSTFDLTNNTKQEMSENEHFIEFTFPSDRLKNNFKDNEPKLRKKFKLIMKQKER